MPGDEPIPRAPPAQELLGTDPEQRLELLERDAHHGDGVAAFALGLLLLESGADEEAGLYWLARAASDAVPGARRLLARALLQGRGLPRPDPREAVRLLLAAGRDGEEEALLDLVHLALGLDPALLFDAALGLAGEPEPLRRLFAALVSEEAPDFWSDASPDLLLALGLDS